MKALIALGLVAAAIMLALAPAISTIYSEAYPAERVKRSALAACARDEPDFNRLFADERARCYQRFRQVAPPETPLVPRRLQLAGATS
jgi:hypothetical protein